MTRVGAIDCGTNSIRLLVADADVGGPGSVVLHDVDRRMLIVRLGQGVDATGRLDDRALARTFEACDEYASVLRELGVPPERLRFTATSATRDAANRDEFVTGVHERLGVEPEVITGDEEAALSFAGATRELLGSLATPFLVVDIGGGSTELVLGTDHPVVARSVDIGCVRLTERRFHHDPPTGDEVAAARADVRAALDVATAVVPVADARVLVGVAGTVTTLAALDAGVDHYDPEVTHHYRLSARAVHEWAQRLRTMTHDQRAALPPMHPGRVDVIAAGALVLEEVVDRVDLPEVVVSEHDILDGVALSVLDRSSGGS